MVYTIIEAASYKQNITNKRKYKTKRFEPTFPVAFLYRSVASLIKSFTRMSPSPQGTTTRTFPKQTVTFIFKQKTTKIKEKNKTLSSNQVYRWRHAVCNIPHSGIPRTPANVPLTEAKFKILWSLHYII